MPRTTRNADAPDLSSRTPQLRVLARSVGAVTALLLDPLRSDRPDAAFESTLPDAGLPTPTAAVTLTAFAQVTRSVPTMAIVRGLREPTTVLNAMTTFLVRHPSATFLIDPAICDDIRGRVLPQLPQPMRAVVTPPSDVISVTRSLGSLGIPEDEIDFALPTHLHWDHVAGLVDLPLVPIRTSHAEWDWAMSGPRAPQGVVRRPLENRAVTFYDLAGPPVLTFERSHDLFGDGSVVLVDMAGHTPGSVGVLLHVGAGDWVLMAGDAVWHLLQVEKVRPTASFPGRLTDNDRAGAMRTIRRLAALDRRVTIVPTHDHDATARYVRG
ncbi:glyoxylase-like metal-dependent hydrolase (beta-lactamase superfamily II) [Promicromonospora sp. AC04]|uniref:MBL fold metallo-hydrolase n=1 Tax=Promicromonospora sp. AC04 TaxID=2135723 RepID=UPI000D3C033B|nr:MBL fold metallo-hydrolase [Promicromonospora sp. AC04]PUB32068.1 glyoxylase-like metal-dependent hydrolase (beta-lactamase superfamily II) [Promicromonospora sp. AC04]